MAIEYQKQSGNLLPILSYSKFSLRNYNRHSLMRSIYLSLLDSYYFWINVRQGVYAINVHLQKNSREKLWDLLNISIFSWKFHFSVSFRLTVSMEFRRKRRKIFFFDQFFLPKIWSILFTESSSKKILIKKKVSVYTCYYALLSYLWRSKNSLCRSIWCYVRPNWSKIVISR